MRRSLSFIALILICKGAWSQDVNKLIRQKEVEKIIRTLSSDEMEGRATFSPGMEKAAAFIEKQFSSAGLLPLKGDSGYRQPFNLTFVTPEKISVKLNGVDVPADNILVLSNAPTLNWSNESNVEVRTIQAGEEFGKAFSSIRGSGKNILVMVDSSNARTFNAYRAHFGKATISLGGADTSAVVFVLGGDTPDRYEVSYQATIQKKPLFNLAGMIPGKSKPDEYVIFSAHFDHLGIINAVNGDSIANGADDDASGTTAVISLARYFSKMHNNGRTLLFIAFTAEEIGEYGSQYFARTIDPDKVTAMFNVEMIGKTSKFGPNSAFITGFERSDFGTILQKNLAGTPFTFYPDPYPSQQLFYRSDNASLASLGVPAHTVSTDRIDIDSLYHTVKDEFSSLDVSNITSTIRAIALGSRSIVSGTDTPTRIPPVKKED